MKLDMALSVKRDEIKQVPWFSPAEWHEVYEQIYSNNTPNQTKAYEALLAWKVRMPKLPVGVDCTLSILQVCLKDREWTSKIDAGELPMYCQNDLSLMYSTTIMRFLNHISNIGHTKQTSLFQIAKQLQIPEWVVNLRHDAAHGHELPSIEVLRMAINVLLQWLHDEYWAPELRAMEEYYMKEDNLFEEEEPEEVQGFTDLIELWTTVSLYIHAGHELVSNIPDIQLRETLQELHTYVVDQCNGTLNNEDQDIQIDGYNIKIDKEYNLKVARALILFEISVYLNKNKSLLRKHDIICDALCENVTFLPNSDIMQILMQNKKDNVKRQKKFLPGKMLNFWKDIIILFQNKGILESLILKLVNIVDNERENKERRLFAAIWINTIAYSFVQLDLAQNISHEYELKNINKKMSAAILNRHIKKHVHSIRPYLRNVLWFDLSSMIPHFLFDIKFLSKLLLNVNEFSIEFIKPICKLVTPSIETKIRQHISNLLRIYVFQRYNSNGNIEKTFTTDDIRAILTKNEKQICSKKPPIKDKLIYSVASDDTIRNLHWKVALDTYKWAGCPIGLLPWQANTLKSLDPLKLNLSKQPVSILDSRIVPGIINNKNLRTESRINWDNVLRKKRKIKRKQDKDRVAVRMMNTALEIAKKQK